MGIGPGGGNDHFLENLITDRVDQEHLADFAIEGQKHQVLTNGLAGVGFGFRRTTELPNEILFGSDDPGTIHTGEHDIAVG